MDGPEPARNGKSIRLEPAWTQQLAAAARGVILARERDWLLAWDANHWLHLLDHAGRRQAQMRFSGTLVVASFADDGSAIVAAGSQDSQGELAWLAPDLMPRWRQPLPQPPLAVAIDAFAQYVAVSDRAGHLRLFDCRGHATTIVPTARALHHLGFALTAPVLLGSADLGLVTCLELDGKTRWRDGLFANVGSLTASADGSRILAACFSEGLQEYDLDGRRKERIAVPEPCRLAAISCSGQLIAVAGLTSHRLMLLDAAGQILASANLHKEVTGLALAALGDAVSVALADGTICQFKVVRT